MAIYRLRASLALTREASGAAVVVDQPLSRVVRLGETDAKLVAALQHGAKPAELKARCQLDDRELTARLSGLARLYLLQGKRAQRRIALQAERQAFANQCEHPAASEAIEWPLGRDPPRHACQGTGTCCGATFLGPLNAADRVRVQSLTFGSRLRDGHVRRLGQATQAPDLFETIDISGKTYTGMARGDDGRCRSQGDDQLCDIHREHGSQAKPVACRLFPLRFHRSPRGVHVSLLLACDGYDRARSAAGPWEAREAEVRALLQQEAPTVRLQLPLQWTPGIPVTTEQWFTLRQQLYALEPDAADAHGWLAAILPWAAQRIAGQATELCEGDHVQVAADFSPSIAGLGQPHQLYDADACEQAVAALTERAKQLQAGRHGADADRLRDLAAALNAQQQGQSWRTGFAVEPQARRHLADIVSNDIAAFVAIGHLDAGLAAVVRRVLLAEALTCVLAQRAGRSIVTSADTTRALHVVYRSEPDLAALAHCTAIPSSVD